MKNKKIQKQDFKDLILSNKRIFALIGASIIVICLFVLVRMIFFKEKMDPTLEAVFNQDKLIPFETDGKYGFLNSAGDVILQPTFMNANEFYDGFASVQIDENKFQIIDKEGKTHLEAKSNPKYVLYYGIWLIDNKIYNSDLEVVFEGNYNVNYVGYGYFEYMDNGKSESGIVDYTGKTVYKWDYDYIQTKISKNEYEKSGYYAFISNYEEEEKIINLKNGKELFTLEDPKNTYIKEENNNIFRIIDRSDSFKTTTWLYINDGKIAYKSNESIYSMSLIKHDEDILEIDYGPTYKDNGLENQYIYYNVKTGKNLEAEPKRVDSALLDEIYGYHSDGCEPNKYGIKKRDKQIASCAYDDVKFLDSYLYDYIRLKKNEHLVLLKKDNNTTLYNMRKKKKITTFNSTSVAVNSNSTFLAVTLFLDDGFTKKSILIYNLLTHKSKEFDKDVEVELGSNYVVLKSGEKKNYYNVDLEEIY